MTLFKIVLLAHSLNGLYAWMLGEEDMVAAFFHADVQMMSVQC